MGTSNTARGAAASLAASALFAVIFLVAGSLTGWGSGEIFGWRVVLTLATLAVILPLMARGRAEIAALASLVRRRPSMLLPGALATAVVGVQLWLFMWAPLNGMALSVSFGYFLLPLTMVVAGRLFFGERLSVLRRLAVAAAALGVAHQAFSEGGLAWPTLAVCLAYPVYFVLRRKLGTDTLAAFSAELLAMLPLGIYFILAGPHGILGPGVPGAASAPVPWAAGLWRSGYAGVGAVGVLGGAAMLFYLLASKWLPLSLFGLLSYVEPVLLVGVSLLLGEHLGWAALLTYGPILLALVLLAVDGRRSSPRPVT